MKKTFQILLAGLLVVAAVAFTTTSGGGGIAKGDKYVNFSFPDSITASETVLFPSSTTSSPSYSSDSINVKPSEFYTYVTVPQLTAARRIKLTYQSYLTVGAQLVIDATADGTSRNLLMIQSAGNDTLAVATKKRWQFFYNGSKFVPVGSY